MKTAIYVLSLLFSLGLNAQTGQTNPFIGTVPAGNGSPTSLGVSCSASNASLTYASLWVDRSITVGNAIWKCTLASDGVTYAWQAPFVAPFMGTGVTAAITPPTLVGCTSGTATVTGATTAMAAIASPIGSPGTGQINSTAYVSAANTVTVTLCLPLTLVYTANPVAYRVLVF